MSNKIAHACMLAADTDTIIRAVKLAAIVGPILILINQWDGLFNQAPFFWGRAMLTLLVPYCVSTYTSVAKDITNERTR